MVKLMERETSEGSTKTRIGLVLNRFDIFYNEETGDFKFCEINTDGTSAMNEDYVLNKAFELDPAHVEFKKDHNLKSWELYDTWVSEFINIYRTYKRNVEKPYIAIVDFLSGGSITEFEEFKNRFIKAGYECEVCEITNLTYKENTLYSPTGRKIDVIYRRAVTSDIFANLREVKPFINAVKDKNVCIIGAFNTQIIHNKWLFKVIREDATLSFLTDEEKEFVKAHIPFTALLSDEGCDIENIINTKDKWIIKPLDSYGSMGVYAGCDLTKDEWNKKIQEYKNKNYIVQEYYHPYTTENICFLESPYEFKPYTNMTGLFVYNGKFAGVYSRLSDGGIISSQYNEKSVPSYYFDE